MTKSNIKLIKVIHKPTSKVFVTKIILLVILLSSCVKNEKLYSPQEGMVYMPQAYQDKALMNLLLVDSIQNITFGIYSAGFNGAPNDITGQFAVQPDLVAQYNIDNEYLGNTYFLLPDTAYTLSGTSTVIRKGKSSSDPLYIAINPKKLALGTHYVLPIKVTNVSGGTLNENLSLAYFKLDTINIRSRDITSDATLTVSKDNDGGADANEGSKKLVDNDLTTKYLSSNFQPGLTLQLKFPSPVNLDAYTLTSGNDGIDRDPKDWIFQGSNNGSSWTDLDTRVNESFLDRGFTRTFQLSKTETYSYYRIVVNAVQKGEAGGLIQITEWRLLTYY